MKYKYFLTLIFSAFFVINVQAQEDCDCPEPDIYSEGICLISTIDTSALWAPDECFAACWYGDEFEIIDCEDVDWGTGDEYECDCPEEDWESEGFCIELMDPLLDTLGFDTLAFVTWVPSLCFADCWYADYDYEIAECEENDWEWEDECDCPEEDWELEGLCIELMDPSFDTLGFDSLAFITWVPSLCFADCWYPDYDYEIAECEENDWEWEDECDCPEEDWESEGLCIELIDFSFDTLGFDSLVLNAWVPSLCFADCWYEGYEYVVADCDNGWEWEDECDCPEEDLETEGICVEIFDFAFDTTGVDFDTLSFVTWVPSMCYAECWYEGSDILLSDCDDGWEWEDECDCPEEDWESEGICIDLSNTGLDSLGFDLDSLDYVAWVPSECFASCWYGDDYTVVECPEYDDGGGFDWELECECELDSEEGICILYVTDIDSLIEWVPNECFADCWGFVDYEVVDCEDFWGWGEEDDNGTEIDFEDNECLTGLVESGITLLQEFLIGLHDCEILVLDECVLAAPMFASDEAFFEYLSENCPEWFGVIMDESDGPSLFEQFNETQGNTATSNENIIEGLHIKLLGNPVVDQLNIQIDATETMNLSMELRTITGTSVAYEYITVNKGAQVYTVGTSELAGGTYLMTMISDNGLETIKFMVAK